jgi:hypothetical protein
VIRTQVELTDQQAEALKALAAKRGVSMAELIRRGIDQVIRAERSLDEDRRKRALAIAEGFRSGLSDLAAEHDRYLTEP